MADRSEFSEAARAEMLAASERWLSQWETYEGAVITGLVTVIEFTVPGQSPTLTYAATDALGNGVPHHRMLGMLVDVQHELAASTINFRRAQEEDA